MRLAVPRRGPARRLWTVLCWLGALVLSGTLVLGASLRSMPGASAVSLPPARDWPQCTPTPPPRTGPGALIVTDDIADQPIAQVYATLAANLASHFGPAHIVQAKDYRAGMLMGYRALVYVGSSPSQTLPGAFLKDVRAGGRPVLWLGDNIAQLDDQAAFEARYGWTWGQNVSMKIRQIDYHGTPLTRDRADTDPLRTFASIDTSRTQVLGTLVTADGRTLPWAVRSGTFTYVGEVPLDAAAENDRYLAVADLLYDLLAPGTPARHRALVRLEDIGPDADPDAVLAAGRLLAAKKIPFSFGVYPVYLGPLTAGRPQREIRMRDRPELVRAITYLLGHNGTMVLHGYTHQSDTGPNPTNGESGQDFEFFQTHWNFHHGLVYDGPIRGDSPAWANRRFDAAAAELRAAHLPMPRIVEFPHYAASVTDYRTAATRFTARFEREQLFSPAWNGRSPASPYMYEQFAPYLLRDTYGSVLLPENLGFVQNDPRPGSMQKSVDTIVANARTQLVVRDNVAGFFYHPFLGTKSLDAAVTRLRSLGYRFVSPCAL